jgi:hypothetical protein
MHHTEAEIKRLSDTPLNRRLIKRWSEQDERGIALQRKLFSQTLESDPKTPANVAQSKSNVTAGVTFQILEDPEFDIPTDQGLVDRAIVSKMIAGSSRSRTFSSAGISEQALGIINIHLEFAIVFDLKKNKCASVLSFVAWLKKHESFKWPSNETGDELRDVLSKLATDLMAEFLAPPKLVAAVQMCALFVSVFHKSEFVSDFHSGLCHEDFEFENFRDGCAQGRSEDAVLKFVDLADLPGFERLTGANSAENWVDMATAVIDSAAFLNIVLLERVYNKLLARWKGFRVGDQAPKQARSVEQELFSGLNASAERAGLITVTESERAHHIIQGISLVVMLLGKEVEVRDVIRDAIAVAKMGRAAVSRKFVFEIYSEQYEFFEHRGSDFKEAQGKNKVLIDHALVTSDGAVVIVCKDCETQFDFTVEEQAFYKEKGIGFQPVRCKDCKKKHVAGMAGKPCKQFDKQGKCQFGDKCRFMHGAAPAVLCFEDGDDHEERGWALFDDEGTDYDSQEDK